MSSRQVSTSYLFEMIGMQHVELTVLRQENESLLATLKKESKKDSPIIPPDPAARGPE